MYGYLGPNGAGKTTSAAHDAGPHLSHGRIRAAVRTDIPWQRLCARGGGRLVEAPRFYPYLSGRRNMDMLAAFDGNGASGRVEAALF